MGELIGAPVELFIAPRLPAELDGRGVGAAPGLILHEVMDATVR